MADVSEIFNLADNLFCRSNKVVSASRKYGDNIAEVSDTLILFVIFIFVLISFLKLTIIDDVSEIFNLADNLFCKFNKVVSTFRKYGANIAEVSDTFNFPLIWSERKIVSVRNKILFHLAVSRAVIPLATLALNNGSVSVKLLNFLFQ